MATGIFPTVLLCLALAGCGRAASVTPIVIPQAAPTQVDTAAPIEAAQALTPTATFTSVAMLPMTAASAPTGTITPPVADPVLLAAGDIAGCNNPGSIQTAALLKEITGTVVTLGDNAYQSGTPAEFANCYDPSWGVAKSRTRPAPGNHDYVTAGAAGYFGYFGAAAGDAQRGYYSYDLGTWHIIALNSNCYAVAGGCGVGSPQVQWLIADLKAHPAACVLAYWHHPRFSSGLHGVVPEIDTSAFWNALSAAGADIILNGHDHIYERFAPQGTNGAPDTLHGIREFVVGTGGLSHYGIARVKPNSQVRNTDTFGILKLTLHAASYDWQFVPVAGGTFTDSGTWQCHTKPAR